MNRTGIEFIRHKGTLERYAELLYRRRIRAAFLILKLNKKLSEQEFKILTDEERLSSLVRSVTFFILGFIVMCAILGVIFAIKIMRSEGFRMLCP